MSCDQFKTIQLAKVASYISRGISPSYSEDDGIAILNQKCIRNNTVDMNYARKTDPSKKPIAASKYLHKYDVLINSTGVGTLGRVAQIKRIDQPITVDSHVTIVRANDCIDSHFLGYSLIAQQSYIEQLGEGSTGQTELSRSKLSELVEISMPPIPEQRAISHILSSLDDKIELNNRMNKTLEEIAQALFKCWFVNFEFPDENGNPYKSSGGKMVDSELGLIPEGWIVTTIGDQLSYISRGITPKYLDESNDIVINQKCIRNLHLDFNEARKHETSFAAVKMLSFGDILVNSTGQGTLGRVAQLYKDVECATTDSHVTIVRPKSDSLIDFIGLTLKGLQNYLEHCAKGSTGQTELSKSSITEYSITCPSLSILKQFKNLARPAMLLVSTNIDCSEILRHIRDTLLPKLMSGEIRVPIAEE